MLAALLSGGIIGTLGSLFNNVLGYFKKKQEFKQQLEFKKLEIEQMDKQNDFMLQQHKIEGDIRLTESADDMQEKSYGHDQFSYVAGQKLGMFERFILTIVDLIRALIRPILTISLLYMVYTTRTEVNAIIDESGAVGISVDEAIGIYKEVVQMILFLSSTSFCWWFGSRPPKGKGKGK